MLMGGMCVNMLCVCETWLVLTWVCVFTAELCAGHQSHHQTPRPGGPRVPRQKPPHVTPPQARLCGQTWPPDILVMCCVVCICVQCVCVLFNPFLLCHVNVVNPTSQLDWLCF